MDEYNNNTNQNFMNEVVTTSENNNNTNNINTTNNNTEEFNFSPQEKNILDIIDKRLEILEKERQDIETKYGINENILNENFQMEIKQLKPSKINYNKLPGIKERRDIKVQEKKIIYKTPDKLIDSLKYEPDIKDLIVMDKENFAPTFSNLNIIKSNPTNPPTYDVTQFVQDDINEEYYNNILY